MKQLSLKIVLLLTMVVAMDILVGVVGRDLVDNAKGGDTQRRRYIARECTAELLIMGSSRAIHHYDAQMLEDSLGLSAYNCGFDGNGIVCNYGYFQMLTARYVPKMIIYDIVTSFDLLESDNAKYLGALRYFYDDLDAVQDIFRTISASEPWKMQSQMYRYNSMLPQLTLENIRPLYSDCKGYRPMDKQMSVVPTIKNDHEAEYIFDSLKLSYLERLCTDCQQLGIRLVMTVSPQYGNEVDEALAPAKALAAKYGIPFTSHYTDADFNSRQDYFYDSSHLNRTGATAYSRAIVKEIKKESF